MGKFARKRTGVFCGAPAKIKALAVAAGCALLAVALSPAAQAMDYPQKPVKIVVPYGPGGAVGNFGQMLADKLSKLWGQPVVVENRPGAASNIGSAYVAKSDPDGYTLLLATNTGYVTNEFIFKNPGFDPRYDLEPVSRLADVNYALVVSSRTGIKNFDDFIKTMRADGGKYNYGSLGGGDSSRLGMETLKSDAKLADIVEIPYPGMAAAVQGLLSGDHDILMVSVRTGQQHIDSGAVVPLAIAGNVHAPTLPNVPTFSEKGYSGVRVGFFLGVSVRAGTDQQIVEKISNSLQEVLKDPEVRATYVDKLGYEFIGSSPAEFKSFLAEQRMSVEKTVKKIGIEKQ